MSSSPDLQSPPGVVELREDVPLKPGGGGGGGFGGGRLCGGGPRLIIAAFAALTLAVTVALLAQIYAGDYEVVPHGSVSSSAESCSAAGAEVLRGGGRAADASVAAALCLAVLAPHRTSLDASGSLIYWEYRSSRSQLPTVLEWGGVAAANESQERAPRLLAALAALHQRYGTRPWAELLQPAIDLARAGYPVAAALSAAAAARGVGGYAAPRRSDPALAAYLAALQHNTSSELCVSWRCAAAARWAEGAGAARAGAWRVWGAGAGGRRAVTALRAALGNSSDAPAVLDSVVSSLQQQSAASAEPWPGGVASGVAVVDPRDTYVALVTGLSTAFGSGASAGESAGAGAEAGADAWTRDEPSAPLDLAPAIIVDEHVCGTRYILGAEAASALAQGAAAMLLAGGADGAVDAVERARTLVLPAGRLLPEPPAPPAPRAPSAPQLPALNFVLQRGDALLSHADSRGGGVAARF